MVVGEPVAKRWRIALCQAREPFCRQHLQGHNGRPKSLTSENSNKGFQNLDSPSKIVNLPDVLNSNQIDTHCSKQYLNLRKVV